MKSLQNKTRLGFSLCLLGALLLPAQPLAASTVVAMDFADIIATGSTPLPAEYSTCKDIGAL